MGSPEKPNKSTISIIASTTSPQSAAFQDSPIFNYINSLSPIKPVKGTSATQVFSGLNSPPLVFTSPRIQTHEQSIDSKRASCHHLTPLTNSSLNNSENAPPRVADLMNRKGPMETYDNKDDKGSSEVAPGASPTFVEQSKEEQVGNLPSRPQPIENYDGKSRTCQSLNVLVDGISSEKYDQRVNQIMQPVFGYKDCGERTGSEDGNEDMMPMMERHLKVGHSQLGKRRRLQFEMAQENNVKNDTGSQNPSRIGNESEALEYSCDKIQNTINASLKVSKPSGIGLHLNSIVNARPLGNISIKSTKGSYSNDRMQNDIRCASISSSSNLEGKVLARSEEFMHETPISCPSYSTAKSVKIIEHQEKFDRVQAERVNEVERSNPKKKRKKTESTGDGCKRCNCKKSKCLKLYCDCFAAGIYCAGPCSCQGCFNRPEYEDTVLETRQIIESKNPLAFAPKIVHCLIQPPKTEIVEDAEQLTPLAGRHKSGCNCKRSMCLKKYCECYQANVGCSDGCRCEGCQNIYGAKKGSVMNREMGIEAINEKLNDSFDDTLKVGPRSKSSLPEFHKPHNLTPQTPSFQHSNHGKDSSKTRIFSGRYLPSPESESTFYPPPYLTTPVSPRNSTFDILTQPKNKNLEMIPLDQELYPNVEFMDEFSPGPPLLSSLSFRGTLFGGTKPYDIIDDDTPKILKDSFTELSKVKVRSPNKKRVSPPRIRLHELGSSSLKSGRKFILKAVPSFPPLTPCIDSKDGTGQNRNDPPGDNTC